MASASLTLIEIVAEWIFRGGDFLCNEAWAIVDSPDGQGLSEELSVRWHADWRLSRAVRAPVKFLSMSGALAAQTKDFGGLVVHFDVVIDDHGGLAWLKQLVSAGGEFWCVMVHRDISTPIFGHYRCLRCNRVYPVRWKEPKPIFLQTTARISPQFPKKGTFGKVAWLAACDWLGRIRSRRAARLHHR